MSEFDILKKHLYKSWINGKIETNEEGQKQSILSQNRNSGQKTKKIHIKNKRDFFFLLKIAKAAKTKNKKQQKNEKKKL